MKWRWWNARLHSAVSQEYAVSEGQGMSKPSIASRLTIRASLILVCLFFLAMLLAGAALGVLSLRDNNQSLERMMDAQQKEAQLYELAAGRAAVQSLLDRVLASLALEGAGARRADS